MWSPSKGEVEQLVNRVTSTFDYWEDGCCNKDMASWSGNSKWEGFDSDGKHIRGESWKEFFQQNPEVTAEIQVIGVVPAGAAGNPIAVTQEDDENENGGEDDSQEEDENENGDEDDSQEEESQAQEEVEEDDISEDMDEEESDIDEERRDSEEDGDNDSSGDDDSDSSGDEDAAIETERLRLERREKRINSQYEDPGNSRQFTTTGSRRRRRG